MSKSLLIWLARLPLLQVHEHVLITCLQDDEGDGDNSMVIEAVRRRALKQIGIGLGLIFGSVGLAVDALGLELREEAFHRRLTQTHRGNTT